ncbi:uncharacterized protein METZ01_LOCUS160535, partial [marine metagenome]
RASRCQREGREFESRLSLRKSLGNPGLFYLSRSGAQEKVHL